MNDKEYYDAVHDFIVVVLKQAGKLILDFGALNELAMETTRRQRELEKAERTENGTV